MFGLPLCSPEGKRFRSRPELKAYFERINSLYKVEDFEFSVHKLKDFTPLAAYVKPAALSSAKKSPVKRKSTAKEPKEKKVKKTPTKKAKGDAPVKRGRKPKTKEMMRSPGRKEKKVRNVLKPPNARSQKLQKLLVKINFGKKAQASSEEDGASSDSADCESDSESEDATPPKKARKIVAGV